MPITKCNRDWTSHRQSDKIDGAIQAQFLDQIEHLVDKEIESEMLLAREVWSIETIQIPVSLAIEVIDRILRPAFQTNSRVEESYALILLQRIPLVHLGSWHRHLGKVSPSAA